ncbi:MAG: cobalamin-binding protein, partial [Gammaproteobacteria bacterium]
MTAELIDAAGQLHRPCPDARIVSLVPSITECLCALGLRHQLVGRTGFCVQPRRWLREVPKLGGTKDVDVERLLAQRPTHVILNIDENRRELADELAGRVPVLVITHPRGPRDNLNLYRLLGGIFCREMAAARLASALERQLAACGEPAQWPRRRVLYLIWY